LQADGSVIAWGRNEYGQASIPASATNVVAIAAGYGHSLALKADGTVVAWGNNWAGQLNIPDSATNVIAIAAGGSHCLALKADGSVIAWGYNNDGQIEIPAGLSLDLPVSVSGTVKFNTPGTYLLTYSTTNNVGAVVSTNRTVVIIAVATTYETWCQTYSLTGDNAQQNADLDGDGVNNLIEYALGGNPTNRDASAIMPTHSLTNGTIRYVYNRLRNDTNVTYSVLTATNLISSIWTNNATEIGYGPINNDYESVTNRITAQQVLFIKLQVEKFE